MTPAFVPLGDRSLAARIGLSFGAALLVLIAMLATLLTLRAARTAEADAVAAAEARLAPLAALAAVDRLAAERLLAGDHDLALIVSDPEPRAPAMAASAAPATHRFLTPTPLAGQPLDVTGPAAQALLGAAASGTSGSLDAPASLLHADAGTPVRLLWQRGSADDAPLAVAELSPLRLRGEIYATALRWCGVALLLAVALGALLQVALRHWLVLPLADLQRRLQRLANGELSAPALAPGGGEIARLHHALDALSDRYAKAFGSLRHSIDRIAAASASIARSNASSRTAPADAEASPANGMVQISANAAREADALARSAAQAATQGGEVVTQVVHTMGEARQGAQRIGEIVGHIDGLAFKTNLLALNAAVEAAKAGEQGRGYSIVAGEVRMLAQRSAVAAKEIRAQLAACNERIETSTRLIETAGSAMNQIVHSVRRVAQVVTTFGRPSAGEDGGPAVADAALSPQQAALLEQTARAAEQLREQAQRLADIMAAFRMAEHAQASSREVIARLRAAAAPDDLPESAAQSAAPAPAADHSSPAGEPGSSGAGAPAQDGPLDAGARALRPARRPPPRPAGAPAYPPLPPVPPAPDGDWEQF